jgi:hypothetical protein
MFAGSSIAKESRLDQSSCRMQHLINGVRHAAQHESWYAALALALAIPDACYAIERGNARSERFGAGYIRWVDTYLAQYVAAPHFSSAELYRYRCAYLHAGDFDIEPPHPQRPDPVTPLYGTLTGIRFWMPEPDPIVPARVQVEVFGGPGGTGAPVGPPSVLYRVNVCEFCEWICSAAEAWLQVALANPAWAARIAAMPVIERVDGTHLG